MPSNVGNKIKLLRNEAKLTQQELAELLNVKKPSIQKYESGAVVNIKIETIEKMAKVFKVSPSNILGWEYHDIKHNKQKLKEDVALLEAIQEAFGFIGVELFNLLANLNEEGKRKLLYYADDIQGNKKYQKTTV